MGLQIEESSVDVLSVPNVQNWRSVSSSVLVEKQPKRFNNRHHLGALFKLTQALGSFSADISTGFPNPQCIVYLRNLRGLRFALTAP